jgi:membrane protein implicated in regulation of membrane protease activity
MEAWVVWTLVACGLAVGEMLTMGFFLAPFSGGAIAAAIVSVAGAGTTPALAVFVGVSLVLFLGIRPLARRHRRLPPRLRTGTAGLIGERALVLERIANAEAVGCVKIHGEVWTARAYDDDEVIEVGERVHVIEIRGATALVGS